TRTLRECVTATLLKASVVSVAIDRYAADVAAELTRQQAIIWLKSLFVRTFHPKQCNQRINGDKY
ncbi:MAG TPA: hypothetical protein VMY06_02055, partial [Sedimentisphaerales bacterium]|nr:hypothetical protein [Sedimentisphaerales bacterium]